MTKTLRWLFDSTLLLPIGAVIALVWANLAPESYGRLAHALEFPINEIGMAFFFALAAKEVVEATVPGGALYPWRRAVVPIFGAAGGMVGPALTYLLLVKVAGDATLVRGWAIPCATDIAFSYLVAVSLFGRSHPVLPFLLLLAIADDAFGLIVLAVFYPVRAVHPALVLGLVGLAVAAALVMKRRKVKSFWAYVLIGGSLSWGGLFVGGLHPALALVPVVPFLPHAAHDAGPLVQEPAAHDTLNEFGRWWRIPVQIILFAFGLANAGVPVRAIGTATWTVLGAILAGKPMGIGLAVALAAVAGFHLPPRMTWRDVLIAGSTAGIGFTVALFFATAAFPDGRTLDEAKLGALLSVGSAGVAFLGAMVLRTGRFTVARAARP